MADVAQSLLEKLQYPPSAGTRKRIMENFPLGMGDWDSDDSDFEPLARTKRKCHGGQKNDQWALWALTEWITERNKRCSDKCPMDTLHTEDAESLAKWLYLSTIKLGKKDGSI